MLAYVCYRFLGGSSSSSSWPTGSDTPRAPTPPSAHGAAPCDRSAAAPVFVLWSAYGVCVRARLFVCDNIVTKRKKTERWPATKSRTWYGPSVRLCPTFGRRSSQTRERCDGRHDRRGGTLGQGLSAARMGKDHDLVIAAKTGNLSAVEKILVQKAKRTGPLARWYDNWYYSHLRKLNNKTSWS